MQLFDLQANPAEQRDVAAQLLAEVTRLKAIYDAANRDGPPSRKRDGEYSGSRAGSGCRLVVKGEV